MKGLEEMIEKRLVLRQKHPTEDLFIHNYSPTVQYNKLWNEITMQTRGLILDGKGNVISRPFGKFFNIEEHDASEIPNEPFEVFDKLDGSLGIMYWINDVAFIASRGSFISEQAVQATGMLSNYDLSELDRNNTYLFEIIYPENRIVVDYNGMQELILLSIRDTKTGKELALESNVFKIAKRYDGINDISTLRELKGDNKEGFVVLFKSGMRVKLKYAEYVRLHRIITGVSSKSIWEYLKTGQSMDEILERVPDEFYDWVKKTKLELENEFIDITNEATYTFSECQPKTETRKEFAEWAKTTKYPSLLFCLKDEKDIEKQIWKMIKPSFAKPFKIEL